MAGGHSCSMPRADWGYPVPRTAADTSVLSLLPTFDDDLASTVSEGDPRGAAGGATSVCSEYVCPH